MSHEARPADADYYETRLELFSQGDIFRDVPLAYPMLAGELLESDTSAGTRRFLSGPFDVGFGMLVTPTCSMRAQGAPHEYARPVRTLVLIRPIDDDLQRQLGLDAAKLGLVRKYDRLINYMYLPVEEELGLPESLASLYMPVTLHHDFIDGQRVTQLAIEGARQLHRALAWFTTGLLESRHIFDPPMD